MQLHHMLEAGSMICRISSVQNHVCKSKRTQLLFNRLDKQTAESQQMVYLIQISSKAIQLSIESFPFQILGSATVLPNQITSSA